MTKLKYILIVFLIIIFISFLFVSRIERFSATYIPFDPTNERTWPNQLTCIMPISFFEKSEVAKINEKCSAVIKYCNSSPNDKKCSTLWTPNGQFPGMASICQKYPGPFCTAAQGWNTASPSFSMNDIQMNTMGAAMGAFDAAMGAGTNAYNTYTPVSQNTVFSGSICNRLQAYENGCRGP